MAELPEPARKMESLSEAVFDPRYGHIIYPHDGVAFTPDMTAATIQALEDFPMDPRDVTVVGYPKSGTNWLAIVLARLYPYWESTKVSGTGRVPDLHVPSRPAIGFEGFGEAQASPPPRLLKSHANFRHMPRAFREGGQGRAIYIARNPKDVCDSYFNQLKGWLPDDWGWDRHFEAFLEGHVFFGSWLENVLGWYAQRTNPQVLILRYEDMRRDPRAAIEQIVAFVGPVPDGTVERVLEETEFAAMQSGELSQRYQPQMVRREGRSGGWKRRFTVAQSEAMDAAFGPALAEIGWDEGDR